MIRNPRRIGCPGYAKERSIIEIPQTDTTWGSKTAICDHCGQRLKLKLGGFGKMEDHDIWVTIHGKDMP